ncbi:selenoprotein S-like [Tigriopus californicus]|uniref:selenoprotein S-like n=1 Tax=Tigriopus californicus TaxID=6832 RepID=UPI0027DA0788|nr:selenoprotein S-like [Tigriopus californicus]XP_059095704.1 selenoprotein S-like [Tigriopus californicus]|eukprot:TCALIF_06760-PA protein Name:"Similar to VIMP Selenoprotein S (Homo sapiens)" AED:0.08 eAED:0.08 QI:16/1/1/1/1/1/3/169/200
MEDEEAYVESVTENDYVTLDEAEPTTPPSLPSQILLTFKEVLNPWYVVFVAVLAFVIYQRFKDLFDAKWARWQRELQERHEQAQLKKNPDLFRAKMEAMEAARRRMQDKYDQESREAVAKMKEREEEKRQQQIQDWENLQQGKGYRNKVKVAEAEFSDGVNRSSQAKKKSAFRPEYNPLMGGAGGSSGYRPSRRRANAGG